MNFMKRFLSKDADQSSDLTPVPGKEELISSLLLIRNDINDLVSLVIDGVDSNRLITTVFVNGGIVEIIFRHNGTISVKGATRWPTHRVISDVLATLITDGYALTAEDDELVKWAQANYHHGFAVNSALTNAFEEMGYRVTEDVQVLNHYDNTDYVSHHHISDYRTTPGWLNGAPIFLELNVTKSKAPQIFNNITEMKEDLTAIGNDLVHRHLVPLMKEVVNSSLTAYQQKILPSFPLSQNTVLPDGKMAIDNDDEISDTLNGSRYVSFGNVTVSEKEVEFYMAFGGLTDSWIYRVFSNYQHEHVMETAFSLALKESGFTKKRAIVTGRGEAFGVKIS